MSDIHHVPDGGRGSILDAAIDRAVRQMVRRDPAAGLRRRVEARITTARVPSAPPVFRYLAAAAAVALLVLAVGLRRERAPEPQNGARDVRLASETAGAPPASANPREPPAGQAAVDHQEARTEPARKRSRRAHADVIRMPAIHNVFGEAADTVTGATVSPGPEAGSAAAVPATPAPAEMMAIPVLSVPPLHVEPLRIAPIRH
jgi:hypothetical protein